MKQFPMVVARAIAALALVVADPALAVPTFTVNDTADDQVDINPGNGVCSIEATPPYHCTLRAAIMEANHTSGLGATIIIPAGVYTLAISAVGSDDESTGDLNLTTPVSGNPTITITGAGAATTIIDGNQIDRVLHIHAGRTVTISGVKVRNGYTVNDGGGIWNEGMLTLTSCTIGGGDLEGNYAHSGGGIKNEINAQLTADASTFSGNFAPGANASGGGLFNRGFANVSTSSFSGNYANIFGGGVYSSPGSTMYLDQILVDNNSGNYGSGVSNAGTMHVTGATISGNFAYTQGGGIYNTGTLDIHGTAISNNGLKAVFGSNQGGGIFNTSSLVIDTSVISGNASYYGAGIYNSTSATAVIDTTSLSGNAASYYGGGISNSGSLQLGASTLNGNSSIRGGGIDNSNTLNVSDSTLSGNNAQGGAGGGIANNTASGLANVYNATIALNLAAANQGGGISNDDASGASLSLRNTLVANNYAPSVGQNNDCAGTLNAYGRDLIGTSLGLPGNCFVSTPVGGGASWTYLNPATSLGPLQNNGGPTKTHALLPGSNAIEGGDPAPPGCANQNGTILTDQRGFPRTSGAVCDIGAFEYSEQIFKNGFD